MGFTVQQRLVSQDADGDLYVQDTGSLSFQRECRGNARGTPRRKPGGQGHQHEQESCRRDRRFKRDGDVLRKTRYQRLSYASETTADRGAGKSEEGRQAQDHSMNVAFGGAESPFVSQSPADVD